MARVPTRFIVKAHRPTRLWVLVVLCAAIVPLAAWGFFEYGRYRAGHDQMQASQREDTLLERIDLLVEEIDELRQEKAVVERAQDIDSQAYGKIKNDFQRLKGEILELKEETAFYRGIVSPTDGRTGLTIQSFKLRPSGSIGQFHYKLILTQIMKNDSLVRGSIHFVVEGMLKGQPQTLSFEQVSGPQAKKPSFRFRYFQRLEGDIILPEGFVPQQVLLTIDAKGKKWVKLEEVIDWSEAAA